MKKLYFVVLLVFFLFTFTTSVSAKEPSQLKARVDDKDPLNPILVITNQSASSCQLVKSALGTVSVSRMQQDAQEISPQPVNVAIDDGLEEFLKNKLQTLNPNESAEIPLQVVKNGEGYAFQAVTWSKLTGPIGMMYPFDFNKPYLLTVTYFSPITSSNGIPMCESVTASNGSVINIFSALKKIGIVTFVIIVLLTFLYFIKSKKTPTKKSPKLKKVSAGLLIFALLLPSLFVGTHRVQAEYTIPESSTGAFDNCLAILDSHPDITGDVLDRLDGARIDIFPTHDGSNWATDWPDGSYRIYWDPTNEYNYYSDDGSVIVSTPCDRLFHEMYHIYELMNGSFSRQFCGSTGIEMKEYNAVRAQNRLRERLGLAPRTHYGTERLPDSCDPAPAPESSCSEDESCGETTGEPHLTTFDGQRYDFQAVGEFVLTRDPSSEFQIQVRQQPWPNARDVSRNTAIAMKMGESKVELRVEEQLLKLFIDGQYTPLETMPVIGGGRIESNKKNKATVFWPDDSKVYISSYDIGMNILVSPSARLKGKLEGLLGNFNDDATDDLKNEEKIITPDFEELYPRYADSWRISDNSSLFTYSIGTNTGTFTDKSFPDQPVTTEDLVNRSPAEALCKQLGVVNPAILENCIFDVAWTGRPEFAYAAKTHQQAITKVPKAMNYGGQTWKAEIKNPGESAEFSFDGVAGEEIFVIITNSSLEYQCGGFGIKDPGGSLLGSGCIIDGAGIINTTPLVNTGKHSIFLDPADDQTGTATVQIIKSQHFTAPITVNGPSVTARMPVPGSHATLTFEGQANQKVFVELSSATISDQCGGFLLIGPNDQRLESLCLADGQGSFNEEGMILPETGMYTITLDPANENIGTVVVKVRE
jgi:hypothetical protein